MRISDWSSDACSSDLTDDPVALMTLHRGASLSLFVLPLAGWLVWAFFSGRGGRVAESPRRWFWAIQAVLLTHLLPDALTVYGTQLLWPLPLRPVMWTSVYRLEEHTSELQSLMRIAY